MSLNILLIGGTFSEDGGKPSGYIKKLINEIQERLDDRYYRCYYNINYINGGKLEDLDIIINKHIVHYNVIIWLPNIDNSVDKYLPLIKEKHSTCILVSSKNNIDNKYTNLDLISRALNSKSNLLIEFKKDESNILATILDPLGNCWCDKEDCIEYVVESLIYRLEQLSNFTRVPSKSIGNKVHLVIDEDTYFGYSLYNFFDTIEDYSAVFNNLIYAANQDRFLGNASFRCTYGFPSFKHQDKIFVSKRNINKSEIDIDSFVAINKDNFDCVEYYGEDKPSVDTPIQLRLYDYYKNINFMIHSHVYIKDVPFTNSKIPCGAINEVNEIVRCYPWKESNGFAINLRGHGSIILANKVEYLQKFLIEDKLLARKLLEK